MGVTPSCGGVAYVRTMKTAFGSGRAAGRARVAHDLAVERAETRRPVGTLESNCLHAASSWIDRSTFIALTARGTPA